MSWSSRSLVAASTWFVARPAFGAVRPHAPGRVARRHRRRAVRPRGRRPTVWSSPPTRSLSTCSTPTVAMQWRVAPVDVGLGQPALGPDVVVVGGRASVTVLARSDGAVRWHPSDDASRRTRSRSPATPSSSATTRARSPRSTPPPARSAGRCSYPGALWSGARDRSRHRRGRRHLAPDRRAGGARARPRHRRAPVGGAHRARYTGAPAVHRGPGRARDRRRQPPRPGRGARPRHWRGPVADAGAGVVRGGDRARGRRPRGRGGRPLRRGHRARPRRPGRLRWQHDLADVLIATRVVLTAHRVAFTSYAGVLHVLDRRDGHVVQTLAPARLGGFPVATVLLLGAGRARRQRRRSAPGPAPA